MAKKLKSDGVFVEITGDKELNKQLRDFGPKVTNRLARKALRKVAAPVKKAVQLNVPKDEGDLRKAIGIKARKRTEKAALMGTIGIQVLTLKKKLKDIEDSRNAKGNRSIFNPHWIEFGAPGHTHYGKGNAPLPPRPFMRPALDQSSHVVRRLWIQEIKAAMDAEAKKAADKVARESGLAGLGVGSAA